jgi:putative phosphonate metabolism protein
MTRFRRYAIYALPEGPLHTLGATWLGWDSTKGRELAPPALPGLAMPPAELTQTPRKYGFHGTIKPPFRLAAGTDRPMLETALAAFCAHRPAPAPLRLTVRRLGRFLALVPAAPAADLEALAAATVAGLDAFRAPPTEAELAKRRRHGLTPTQEANLAAWGYPFVMDAFRFHLTLTGPLPEAQADPVEAALTAYFAPALAAPVAFDSLCLMGEAADTGRFHLLRRYGLSGTGAKP